MKMLSITKSLAAATVALGMVAAGNAAAQEQTVRVGTVSGPDEIGRAHV